MKSTRADYERYAADYFRERCPELESPLLDAIDAYDKIRGKKRLNPKLLAQIVKAAKSSRRPLYENATDYLGNLTRNHPAARSAVEQMAIDPRSQVRFNAILCLTKSTPRSFTLRILRQGLRDKSARVRRKTADWAGRLRIHELVPVLEEALAIEKNAKAKATIEFELRLLRDGYILEGARDGGFEVTTFSSDGVAGRWVSRSELKRLGIKAIVADLADW